MLSVTRLKLDIDSFIGYHCILFVITAITAITKIISYEAV